MMLVQELKMGQFSRYCSLLVVTIFPVLLCLESGVKQVLEMSYLLVINIQISLYHPYFVVNKIVHFMLWCMC